MNHVWWDNPASDETECQNCGLFLDSDTEETGCLGSTEEYIMPPDLSEVS